MYHGIDLCNIYNRSNKSSKINVCIDIKINMALLNDSHPRVFQISVLG